MSMDPYTPPINHKWEQFVCSNDISGGDCWLVCTQLRQHLKSEAPPTAAVAVAVAKTMVEDTLYLQLHKLTTIKSEEALDHILSTLWKTRKSGLPSPDKSHFQSLLDLPSLSQLDPVLACLRSLIRKCVYQNFTGEDLLKLFPPDLPLDLQSILVLSLQKNQERWKEDISREQHLSPGSTSVSNQFRTNVSPSFPSLETSTSPWQRQDPRLNPNDFGIPVPLVDINGLGMNVCLQSDNAPADNLESLPRLKSMTWTLENHSASPADKVVIISLKGGTSSGPTNKKQKL
ncbi:Far1-related sequence 3 [Senna tora]|uniref:Far1-related sequence 3 n=1 Tax=Senna tora TaxID=362788 RepID=A0A834SCG3_9FABA|nr:Far1-related sequence 3 [Senna tora]